MVSWFPHITLHKFYRDIWGSIILDICFHLTVVAASSFLTYYICILMKSAANIRTDSSSTRSKLHVKNILKNDFIHVISIVLSIGIIFFFLGRLIPIHVKPNKAQKAVLGILAFAESCLLGCSVAFLVIFYFPLINKVKIIPIIRKIQDKMVKKRAMLITICITWMLASWWPHMKMHLTSKAEDGKIIFPQYLALSIVFHWTVMFCSAVISYVLYGVIQLVIDIFCLVTNRLLTTQTLHFESPNKK